MDILKKNRAHVIEYFNAISGVEKPRELLEKYTNDQHLIEHIQFFEGAFPKYELFIEEMVTEGNKVIVQGRATGVHEGKFNGIPPTGKTMDLPFAIRYIVENNMITDHWIIADQMILLEQLGAESPQTIKEETNKLKL